MKFALSFLAAAAVMGIPQAQAVPVPVGPVPIGGSGSGATYSPLYVSGSSCFADCQGTGGPNSPLTFRSLRFQLGSGAEVETPDSCAQKALQNNYIYFGLQDGGQCFADNRFPSQGLASAFSLTCDQTCHSDPTQPCGGGCASQVYTITQVSGPVPVPGSSSGAVYSPVLVSGSSCFADCQGVGGPDSPLTFRSLRFALGATQRFPGPAGEVETPDSCAQLALQNNYTFFGLQDGGQCFADTRLPNQGLASAFNLTCDETCHSDSTKQCGGACASQVYEITTVPVPVGPVPIGGSGSGATYSPLYVSGSSCFADCQGTGGPNSPLTFRSLRFQLGSGAEVETPDSCALRALQNGFTFFGLQDGGQCFADNRFPSQGLASASPLNLICDKTCYSDHNKPCGGACASQVYTITKA